MKTCSKCKVCKPFTEFHKRKNRKSGYVSKCKVCIAAYSADWYIINKDELLINSKESKKTWYQTNRQKELARNKKYHKTNKLEIAKQQKEYRKANASMFTFYAAARRTLKAKATPNWLNEQQLQEIKDFYSLAKELSWLSESPLEVDHIVPIKGKNVVGLHVPWNLQILPKTMNQQKGTKIK